MQYAFDCFIWHKYNKEKKKHSANIRRFHKKNLFSFNSVLNVWLIVTIPSIHKFNAKGTDVDHGLTFDLAVYRIQYVRMENRFK